MESLTKNKQSIETIKAMAKSIFNKDISCDEDAIVELKDGWFNVAYRVRLIDETEVILKIAPRKDVPVMTYEENMMSREVMFMRKIKALDIPCPDVYGYDDTHTICDSDYFFMEKLQGDSLEHIKMDLSEQDLKEINTSIGVLTKTWQHDKALYFGYPFLLNLQAPTWKEAFLKMMDAVLKDGKRHQVDLGYDYTVIMQTVFNQQDCLDEVIDAHFVHWDCWDSNVFVDRHQLSGILDFERGFYGDPLAEALFRMKHPDQLIGYGKTNFTDTEIKRMRLYDLYLALVMGVEDSFRHYDTHDIRNYGLYQIDQYMKELSQK
jgi:aminoglycoside phosphotransferase (APT) family kinase protein